MGGRFSAGGGGGGGQVNWLLFEPNVAGVQEPIRSNKVQRQAIWSVGTPFTVVGGGGGGVIV